jgi:hypothetical protein
MKYTALKLEELVALCARRGLEIPGGATKDDCFAALYGQDALARGRERVEAPPNAVVSSTMTNWNFSRSKQAQISLVQQLCEGLFRR